MRERHKILIHRLNIWLNKPVSVIIVLLLLFAYFAYQNANFQKDSRTIINQTNTSVSNSEVIVGQLKKVLCENIPQKDCNLSQAVAQLKANNDEQTVLLCKLFLSGNTKLPDADADQVAAICKQRIETLSITSSAAASSGRAGATPQGASQPSSQGGSSSPNSAPNNGNGQTNNSQPDNEGMILDLPLLPKVHIPSPL